MRVGTTANASWIGNAADAKAPSQQGVTNLFRTTFVTAKDIVVAKVKLVLDAAKGVDTELHR